MNTFAVIKHPVGRVYFIVAMPGSLLVKTPVLSIIVSNVGVLVLHLPPVLASCSVSITPGHNVSMPVMGNGIGLTFTSTGVAHPGRIVYTMDTVSAFTPVTIPDELTVATVLLRVLHNPPASGSARAVVLPGQTSGKPVMAGA